MDTEKLVITNLAASSCHDDRLEQILYDPSVCPLQLNQWDGEMLQT